MVAAIGNNECLSLSLVLEVEEELSTMVTLFWPEGVWRSRWRRGEESDLQSTKMEASEATCRVILVRNSRLGHSQATLAHFAVRGAGGGGNEGGPLAGCERDADGK